MRFSIIVPIYNVEDYLEECVDSLLEQDFNDYEILLIDDGSTDNSGKICDNYLKKSNKIRCFHKKNGGLSDARNFGISNSIGDFLIFVDSDDFIRRNCLKQINDKIVGDVDVIITKLVEKYPDKDIEKDLGITKYFSKTPKKKDVIEWIFNKSNNTWPAQKYIISKKFLDKTKMYFRKNSLHEDLEWTTRVFLNANTFQVYYLPWYYHRMKRDGSITNTIKHQRIINVLEMTFDLIYGKYSDELNKLNKKDKTIIKNRLMESVYYMLGLCVKLNDESLTEVEKALIKYKAILKYSSRIKHIIFSVSINMIGFKRTIKLYRRIIWIKKY